MPITPTYPGVYVEEVPSGVRTITGVSTSITAFVGYSKKGPINKAEEILSFSDFERKFGGLTKDSLLGYAVQQFFLNGGQQACVVRITQEGTAKEASITLKSLASGSNVMKVFAREPGTWGNGLKISIDYQTAHPDSTFNMQVVDPSGGGTESFSGLTMAKNAPRYIESVVNATSSLIKVEVVPAAQLSVSAVNGKSVSGSAVNFGDVDADHRQFMITLDHEDGPQTVTIYDGNPGNLPTDIGDLVSKITSAVKAIDPSREPYQSFLCSESSGVLTLTSGEQGDGSFVRVTAAGSLDASGELKLGVANGGRETDAAASIRPAPVGTTSGDLSSFPSFTSDRKLMVKIDGDGPHEVTVFKSGTDQAPTNLKELSQLLQKKLRAVKPKQAGSMNFMGVTSKVVGNSIQILSGSTDSNSMIKFENTLLNKNLNGNYFVSGTNGWAVGADASIIVTIDGGTTWTEQNPPTGFSENLNSVYFHDANNGWAVGENGSILATPDGGANWVTQAVPAGFTETLNSVYLQNVNNGWAVGENGSILATPDGGANWATQAVPAGFTETLNSVYFQSPNNCWAVGDNGSILYTGDGGVTPWTLQQPPVTDTSSDDLMLSNSPAWVNVKAYTLGIGKLLGAQTNVISGEDGLLPQANDFKGNEAKKTGIYALLDVDLFNILCLPGVTDFKLNDALSVLSAAESFCQKRRAFLIVDCPESWLKLDDALDNLSDFDPLRSKNASMYFPRVKMPDPLDDNRLRTFPPCGIAAGLYARTDSERGVWKAPAGQDAKLRGVSSLVYRLTDKENGLLNPLGLNCLRTFPVIGPIAWGARTLEGADILTSEWKYIPVRRMALFLEESLYRGLKWVVFEPNDEPLWSQIRLNVGAFMHRLFRQGAFQGTTPKEAYLVKCDSETTTQTDINLGIVNIVVGFAPLKPAEFVIIKIKQLAGQIQA